jgi:monovalent cation:H+ antiporter-2, CPA2 family
MGFMNQILFSVSMMCMVILLLIFFLKKFNQPYMVAYILAGVLIGPFVGQIFTSTSDTTSLGEIGILLLMFFLGMEIDIPDRHSLLLKPVIAQSIKMVFGIIISFCLGTLFHWPFYNILLLTILFIFNSTAVVSEYLSKNGELNSAFGKSILNILLLQDILLAPVLTVFQFVKQGHISVLRVLSAISACVVIVVLLRAARHRNLLRPSFLKDVQSDHELQVFLGGFLCLGCGYLAELAGLSGAIGSFVAGMVIGRTPAFHWLEHSLKPFRVFFVSFFFMSIGLRLDLSFIAENFRLILAGTVLLLLSNSVLSTLVFRLLRYNWKNSLYGGALLSQAGEFGILACSLAYEMNIIGNDFFKAGIAITALSLLLSTTWITVLRKIFMRRMHTFSQ